MRDLLKPRGNSLPGGTPHMKLWPVLANSQRLPTCSLVSAGPPGRSAAMSIHDRSSHPVAAHPTSPHRWCVDSSGGHTIFGGEDITESTQRLSASAPHPTGGRGRAAAKKLRKFGRQGGGTGRHPCDRHFKCVRPRFVAKTWKHFETHSSKKLGHAVVHRPQVNGFP